MRRVGTVMLSLCLLAGCSGGNGEGPGDDQGTVLFLHHSTGGNIFGGGVPEWFDSYNAQNAKQYSITERAYPDEPYPWQNYPYDYWYLWVANAGNSRIEGQETLDMLAPRYDLIVFKHCFPVSMVEADTGAGDVASDVKSIENYQLQYQALKQKLQQFADKRFLVWTGAALTETALLEDYGGTLDHAGRARDFFQWVKNDWDEAGDNIFVFDFFELETEGGTTMVEAYASGPTDPHPSETFAQEVAPRFSQRVVDVLEGRGDTGSLTGE